MDTLTLRLAAAGGRIDDLPASQLVAAGFTLLQRSAPLVRMLAGRRSALLLPPGPAAVVAMAASDGRGAVVLPLGASAQALAALCAASEVGAVFTTDALRSRLPASLGVVCLDRVPRAAVVHSPDGREQTVDLGSHVGLTIEGATDIPGREEECLLIPGSSTTHLTHRDLLGGEARAHLAAGRDDEAAALVRFLVDLLAGGRFLG